MDNDFYLKTINYFGFVNQCYKLKEECQELIEAIDKMHIVREMEAPSNDTSSMALDDFIEECVDVSILIEQFKALLGGDRWNDIKVYKLNRLKELIKYEQRQVVLR